MRSLERWRGMSFMDVVIGTALLLIVFLALSGLLRSSLTVAAVAKSKAVATSIAESQMEYVRSLSYDAVGTVGGIPAGTISQYATTTANGLAYQTRTYIEYVDDPADGLDAADSNHVTTDYKRIKVSVTYTAGGRPHSVDIISNYAPPGLETTNGGGTLRANIVNAAGAPVSGASVRVLNTSTSPTVDVTTFSDVNGIVDLPGAATSTQFQIFVTKSGYSSAQTYARDATNQNPTPGYLTIVKNQTTAGTFAIDLLTPLTIRTFSPIATTTWSDTFNDASGVTSQSNVAISGGNVVLASASGVYVLSGTLQSIATTPTYLSGWKTASASTSLPPGTNAVFHVADGSGNLIPDTALPGNAAGFTASVDLSGLPISTYPTLTLKADLTTTSTAVSPMLQDWTLTYIRGPVPLPNISMTLTGGKTVGSTGAGAPIYKTTVPVTTNASGVYTSSLEWDAYQVALASNDVVDSCNAPPYTLSPGTAFSSDLILGASTANMLLVSAKNAAGAAIPGAQITLSRTGFTQTVTTSACGAAYFGGLTSSSAYSITGTATGYTTFNATNVSVAGKTFYAAPFD